MHSSTGTAEALYHIVNMYGNVSRCSTPQNAGKNTFGVQQGWHVQTGLQNIVACSQPYLVVRSCVYSFWHGMPTSYFTYNDFILVCILP